LVKSAVEARQLPVTNPFHCVIYGDARFHDPQDTEAANPPVRRALVQAIAEANPAAANTLMLMLDSSLDEVSGPQGEWLNQKLDHLSGDVDFVLAGAHPDPIDRAKDDPSQSKEVNYHYLMVDVDAAPLR